MNKLLLLIVLTICLSGLINSQSGVYPDSGVYVSLNSNFLSAFGSEFTTTLQNQVNAYAIADVNGKNGDISYEIKNIQHSIQLADFTYSQVAANSYNIGWNTVTFTITADFQGCYKIRADKDLSICEKGNAKINTQANLSIFTSITLDFDQSTPTLVCTGTTLNVPANGINYQADCTSKVCAKTHVIRDEIAQQFVPKVESTITSEINTNSGKYLPLFPTLRDLNFQYNGNSFYLNSQGSLVESSQNTDGSLTPTMTLALNGGVVLKQSNGNFVYPSQSPTGLPSFSELESFDTDISITLTSFFFESLIDAMTETSLPMTIVPSQVPAESPIQLNTSDPFFNQTAPGLTAAYPNSAIQVVIGQPSSPAVVSLNSTGLLVSISLPISFSVENNDVFEITISFDAELTPSLMGSSTTAGGISATATLDKLLSYVKVDSTTVGDINTLGFIQLIQLAQGMIKIPTFTIQSPLTLYSCTNLSLVNGNQFVQILSNLVSNSLFENNNNKINIY